MEQDPQRLNNHGKKKLNNKDHMQKLNQRQSLSFKKSLEKMLWTTIR